MDKREKKLDSKEIYKGKILDLWVDDVLCPNGNKSKREVIRHCKVAAILAFDIYGKVILEDQYRYPYDKIIKEIPAGKCDSPEEDPKDTAFRELKEETGYTAKNLEYLGCIYPSCAYTDEIIYIYMATGLTKGDQKLDPDETLDFYKVSFNKLIEMINQGEIQDAKTLAAVSFYLAKFKPNKKFRLGSKD